MLNQDIQTVGRVRPGKTKVTTRLRHIEDSIEPHKYQRRSPRCLYGIRRDQITPVITLTEPKYSHA